MSPSCRSFKHIARTCKTFKKLRDMSELNFLNLTDHADVDGVELLVFPVGTRAAGLPKIVQQGHIPTVGVSYFGGLFEPPKNSESDKKMSAKIVQKQESDNTNVC